MTLSQITHQIVDIIIKRSEIGKDYGVILLPEGLIEFIPEFNVLINQINDILATGVATTEEAVVPHLSYNNRAVFSYLPSNIKLQLLLDRDPHGNVQVSQIETERLLAATVSMELDTLRSEGKYHGNFEAQYHSFGYEGRSGLPSVFDSTYCYALGQNVAAMISLGLNGIISSITNLTAPVSEWECGGVPITMMCHMEKRIGKKKPVIKKALVELDGKPFQCFANQRDSWAIYDLYRSPGPIQFFDSKSLDLCITLTLELKNEDSRMDQNQLKYAIKKQKQSMYFYNFYFIFIINFIRFI
jgi:diphosphate--fructose-6-phosphate 1-phosphotransferase